MEKLKQYWQYVLIVLLLILIVIFWQSNQSTKKELEKIKLEQSSAQQLKDINSKLDEIKERQKMYSQIDATLSNINKNIKESKDRLTTIEKNIPRKEQIYEEFKKKNLQQISEYFLGAGYPNTIISK